MYAKCTTGAGSWMLSAIPVVTVYFLDCVEVQGCPVGYSYSASYLLTNMEILLIF